MDLNVTRRLASEITPPKIAAPVRYATVISVQNTAGTATVRPSNATATDGSQDIAARFLTPVPPGIGAYVRIEVFRGDVVILGAPGVDDFPAAPFAMASGQVTIAAPGAVPGASTTITTGSTTFPTGRFSQAPHVTATVQTTGSVPQVALVSLITSSGFTATLYQIAGTATANVIHWTAVQMDSTNATG